ncbi:hypothetical protein [Nonomuraea sp. NPDC048916]|uniref:hypothetical protein n=1 Tax=Nonomuraea sp. NPDC048916 TaxID=3154232 RepID=UPI0033D74276
MGKSERRKRPYDGSMGTAVRVVLGPLARGSTCRRGVFLLLGGVLLLPYSLLAVMFTQMLTGSVVPRALVLLFGAVAAVIVAVPVFVSGSRALEIAAARALLDVDLPEPVPGSRIDPETRLRSALWISLHLITGGLITFGLISVIYGAARARRRWPRRSEWWHEASRRSFPRRSAGSRRRTGRPRAEVATGVWPG